MNQECRWSRTGWWTAAAAVVVLAAIAHETSRAADCAGCGPNGCEVPRYRVLPYRQQQESQQFRQSPAGGNPWPTLPNPSPASDIVSSDLTKIQQQLARITDLLGESVPPGRSPPVPAPATADPAAAQAISIAQQAAETAAASKKRVDELESATSAVKAGQEKMAGQLGAIAENHGRLAEMVAKHGTLAERFEARKTEVDAKLGEHASKLEKVHEFARSLIEDKLSALKEGHGDTRLILLIVVLAIAAVFVMGVIKDVTRHKNTGEPLAIGKLASHLASRAVGQPWLTPAANLAGHAAHDVSGLINQIDQRIQAHRQADALAKVTAAATPVPATPVAAAAPTAAAPTQPATTSKS